jgi:hypothetical protein
VGDQVRKTPGSTGVNPYAQLIEDAEGLDKIEVLQDHPNEDLYEKVGLGLCHSLVFHLHVVSCASGREEHKIDALSTTCCPNPHCVCMLK